MIVYLQNISSSHIYRKMDSFNSAGGHYSGFAGYLTSANKSRKSAFMRSLIFQIYLQHILHVSQPDAHTHVEENITGGWNHILQVVYAYTHRRTRTLYNSYVYQRLDMLRTIIIYTVDIWMACLRKKYYFSKAPLVTQCFSLFPV